MNFHKEGMKHCMSSCRENNQSPKDFIILLKHHKFCQKKPPFINLKSWVWNSGNRNMSKEQPFMCLGPLYIYLAIFFVLADQLSLERRTAPCVNFDSILEPLAGLGFDTRWDISLDITYDMVDMLMLSRPQEEVCLEQTAAGNGGS